MAERVISYAFVGNFNSLRAGLASAGASVEAFGTKLTALDAKGAKMRSGLSTLSSTAGKIGLVGAVGLGLMVKAAADFDQAMSNVQAATHETADNMELLRTAALKAGADTVFSATEAASAIESLAKAGVSTKDILGGGLKGSLDLAAAGSLDVGQAAEIAATAMTQFKLSGQAVPHIADLLAAGAGKAQGEVTDLAAALQQSGLVASQMGLSIEQTTGTLAAFASAGLMGSDAGTSLKTMLLRLANPTEQSAKLMEQLGIHAYDANGQFVGMVGIANQLTAAFEGKTQAERDSALATIFGSDAIRAASVLYAQGGEGIKDWTKKVNDSGYAAETAATRMDNLKGDLEQLGGSLETALIGSGSGAQSPLRSTVQDITKLVNAYNDLPGPVKNATAALAGITTLLAGGFWFGAKVITGITDTRKALTDLAGTAPRTATALSMVGKAAGAAAALFVMSEAIDALERHMDAALPTANELAGNLLDLSHGEVDSLSGQFDHLGSTIDTVSSASGGFVGTVQDLTSWADKLGAGGIAGLFFDSPSQAIGDQVDEIKRLDEALTSLATTGGASEARRAFRALAADQGLSIEQQQKLRDLLPGYRDALAGEANQAKIAAGGTKQLGDAAAGAAPKLSATAKAIQANRQAAREAADGFFDLSAAFEAPTMTLDHLLERMQKYADAALHYGENLQKALDLKVDPAALDWLVKQLGPAAGLALQQIANGGKKAADRVNAMYQEILRGKGSVTDALTDVQNRMDGLGKAHAKPKVDADISGLRTNAAVAEHALDVLDHKKANPKAELQGWKDVLTDSLTAGRGVDNLGKKRANPIAKLIDNATPFLQHILGLLNSVNGYHANATVTTTYRTVRAPGDTAGGVPAADGTNADGGTIPKDGKPYADRYLYWLAPGEEVISNRNGQADRFREDRAAGRIPAYADGGTAGLVGARVSGTSGVDYSTDSWVHAMNQAGSAIIDLATVAGQSSISLDAALKRETAARKKHLEQLLKVQQDERDAIKERLDALRQERQSIMEGVANLITGSADLLGTTRTPVIPAVGSNGEITWTDSPATFASFSSALDTQFGTASQLTAVLRKLKHKGIGGAVLSWLIQNGATISTLEDFANQSAADLAGVAQQFHAVQQATHAAGNLAGNVTGTNQAIDRVHRQLVEANKAYHRLEKRLENLDKTGKDGVKEQRNTTAAVVRTGGDMVAALRDRPKVAARRARR